VHWVDETEPARILVLDDEAAVGETLCAIARSAGFAARSTTDPDEFLRVIAEWKPTHLVVDLMMPRVDGIEVIHRLAERHAEAALILTSGVGSRVLEAASRTAAEKGMRVRGLLAKPVRVAAFRALLAEAPVAATAPPGAPASETVALDSAELEAAIDNGRIAVRFKPKISCRDGSLAGFEAKPFWPHPRRGLLALEPFVTALDSRSVALTAQVAAQAIGWLADAFHHSSLMLSLNVPSGALGDTSIVAMLSEQCARHRIEPRRIIVEVAEASALASPGAALELMTQLRVRGFHLALDDVGAGPSSLVQLARLPISELKIDGSFVRTAPSSEESRKIILAIVGLAQSLGLRLIANGVDTKAALRFVTDVGCEFAQGSEVCDPMDAEAAVDWALARTQQAR
jgi:EAL domain-containing protein (putative c-di-GMP-specific phosphodiesterase class I)/ActR/RegA family two-component response regulator